MASTPPFVLQPAKKEDMKEILDLQYRCFPDLVRRVLMGCDSEADLPRLQAEYIEEMEESGSVVWHYVKDLASGRIIAASNWKIFLNRQAALRGEGKAPGWLQGERLAESKRAFATMNDARARIMQDGYIHLHICFTHPDYRRRAAGNMMLQWGCDLADHLALPAYIEASTEGNFLYKRFGFYDHDTIHVDGMGEDTVVMLRDARPARIAGGKPRLAS